MKRRDLILSIIHLCSGHSEFGRTSLQKVAYWAGRSFDFQLGHRAYYYGPFSSVVEQDVEALVMSGLVDETSKTIGNSGGWEINKYQYALTDDGNERIGRIAKAYPDEFAELKSFIDRLIDAVGGLHQSILASATKLIYIEEEEKRKLPPEEISVAAKNLGWELSTEQVQRVRRLLDDLAANDKSVVC